MKFLKKRTFGQWVESVGHSITGFGFAAVVFTLADLKPSWALAAWLVAFGFAMGIAGAVLHAAMHDEPKSY